MFDWLCSFFASAAFDAALYSAGLASTGGMHQMKEPEAIQKYVEEKIQQNNN